MPDKSLPASISTSDLPAPPQDFGGRSGALTWRPENPEDGGGGASWERYIAAVRRYRLLVAAVTVVGTVGGFFVARRMPRQYEVNATIWVGAGNNGNRGGGQDGPIRGQELLQATAWADLVRAPVVLEQVVVEQRLYVWPIKAKDWPLFAQFTAAGNKLRPGSYTLTVDKTGANYTLLWNRRTLETGGVGDSVGRSAGFNWLPSTDALTPGASISFVVLTPRDAANGLGSSLSVTLPERSNFMRLALTGGDPKQTAITMNSIIRHFVVAAADLKSRNLVEFGRTLESQVDYSQTALRDAETALENFRVHTITLPTEGTAVAAGVEVTRDPVFKEYFERKLEYENVTHDRQSLEQAINDLNSGTGNVGSLQALPAVQNAPPELKAALDELSAKQAALRAAQQTYTDEHPTVKDLKQQVEVLQRQTIPTLASHTAQALHKREDDLASRISGATREIQDIPMRTIEEMRLRRDVAVKENLYTMLKNRLEEAKLAQASAIPDVSVLDTAVAPLYPINSQGSRLVFVAVIASLGAGLALAILLDRVDRRVRYTEQVVNELGLYIIGAVQTMRKRRSGQQNPEEIAQVVEAFRSIRMHVTQSFPPGARAVFVISSAGPGEGKSLVAANLALCFAEAGTRTLLIDGDIRRGQLHSLFEVERRPGLIDTLADGVPVETTLRTTTHPNLTFLPSGSRRQHGPEQLESESLMVLAKRVWPAYDVIIIDAPPLNAGIDAFALATLAGSMLLVVRAGVTDRKMAAAKLAVLDRLPIRLLGAVFNGIHSEYGEYKYYSYAPGYTLSEGDEEDGQFQVLGAHRRPSRKTSRR